MDRYVMDIFVCIAALLPLPEWHCGKQAASVECACETCF